MRRRRAVSLARMAAVVLVLLAAAGLLVTPPAAAQTSSLERAVEAVVAITSGADRIGTGVVIAEDRILTVAHVVDAAAGTPASIIAGNAMVPYEVVAIDRRRDLALLSADLPSTVPAIVWTDGAALTRGQDVLALGFPIGFRSVSLTRGIVSSPLQTYQGSTFVQTDAAINPGNSGGPLVDLAGRLVGISVAKIAQVDVDAVGFAVPASDVLDFLAREAPDIRVLMDTSAEGEPAEAVPMRPGATRGLPWPTLLLAGGLVAVLAALAVVARRRGAAAPGAGEPSASHRIRSYGVFRVSTPAGAEELDLRLPAVAGTAPNADIPLTGMGTAAYRVRFSSAPGGVSVLDLTDERGMYCGEACVTTVVLAPGASVRVGETTIVLVRTYDA